MPPHSVFISLIFGITCIFLISLVGLDSNSKEGAALSRTTTGTHAFLKKASTLFGAAAGQTWGIESPQSEWRNGSPHRAVSAIFLVCS